jgi:hypothetical protein
MTIVAFPTKSHDPYFGCCPHCGRSDGWLNVGPVHWIRCDRHKTKWSPGANIFSSWQEENEELWRRNYYFLANYIAVEPIPCSDLSLSVVVDSDDALPF